MNDYIEVEKYLDHLYTDEKSILVFKALLKKFEIKRKIYTGYTTKFKEIRSFKELTNEQYQKLVFCFLYLSFLKNDIRYYNTALKVADKIRFELPTINYSDFDGEN